MFKLNVNNRIKIMRFEVYFIKNNSIYKNGIVFHNFIIKAFKRKAEKRKYDSIKIKE